MNTKKGIMHLPQNASVTSDTIFFNTLFDSFNGNKGQGLTSIITATSNHTQFWRDACNKLYQMKFVEKKTHQAIRRNSPKCLVNWIWTIQSAKYLWYVLQKSGFSSFNLKHINQDMVENSFSKIRDNGHRNNNPTTLQFSAAFKTLVLNATNLISNHCISLNCEENEERTSLSLLRICHANNIIMESETNQKDDIEYTDAAILDAITNIMFVDSQKVIAMKKKNVLWNVKNVSRL